ncbi:23S rRNA (adenine(2030)-N(6))-methyltransferase RlmJ [Caedibacter taeniospiralis]|uniref:23S rRNA (adenine(2030)-N(6))-methyltransferase RlmJ n=1 Tax=Caedibacter taeniospiralis TaxID=28907 RepID=UPI000C26F122|nr:23S rRNA (adenine(2030)-N(6))-methyltransferase RlmJ [Caedibacter taeniospiralis]
MSLSYQHIYHAGNLADVHKHLWLIAIVDYLGKKEKPFFWLDTHAGRGVYDLNSIEARKTKEAINGIGRLLGTMSVSNDPLLIQYKGLIDGLNEHGLQFYPGSCRLAASLLRESDRMCALELHPQEVEYLKVAMRGLKQVAVKHGDMLKLWSSFLPPKERRGGMLIDPSFEIKTEYEIQAKLLIEATKKWSTGVYMLWYPLLPQRRHEELKNILLNAQLNMQIDEWQFQHPAQAVGMYGSGMVIVNPPYTVYEKVRNAIRELESGYNPN